MCHHLTSPSLPLLPQAYVKEVKLNETLGKARVAKRKEEQATLKAELESVEPGVVQRGVYVFPVACLFACLHFPSPVCFMLMLPFVGKLNTPSVQRQTSSKRLT